ncbi:NAD(P)-binding protein [Heliocybe sulcata]|uniref:NAD(P)-binding protein n=1 Tax=Heliocybe sulcata TaxID=5364 RepID=A0A5C3MWS3_9AGAM|nr:NAD(P)-binding protein [Heliocybe sulcata]
MIAVGTMTVNSPATSTAGSRTPIIQHHIADRVITYGIICPCKGKQTEDWITVETRSWTLESERLRWRCRRCGLRAVEETVTMIRQTFEVFAVCVQDGGGGAGRVGNGSGSGQLRANMFWRLWASSNGINYFKHGEESWALVTGASDGIGKAVCKALAQKGFNVILHGRTQEKLNSVKEELQAACPERKFEIVVADATQASLVPEVAAAVKDKHVTILFNNLTRAMLPQLIANKPSAVVNVGSFVAAHPPPFLSVYAGAKGYSLAFSRALRTEMRLIGHKDVDIQYHEVHSVATQANGRPVSTIVPHPDAMARAILVAIGRRTGFITPYWAHELTSWFMSVVPETWLNHLVAAELQKERTDLQKSN